MTEWYMRTTAALRAAVSRNNPELTSARLNQVFVIRGVLKSSYKNITLRSLPLCGSGAGLHSCKPDDRTVKIRLKMPLG